VGLVALTTNPLFALLGLGGLACATAAVWMQRRARDMERLDQLREEQIERRLRGRSAMQSRLREAEELRDAQLKGLGANDLAAAEALLATEERLVSEVESMRAELSSLLASAPSGEPLAVRLAQAEEEADRARRAFLATGELASDLGGRREAAAAAVRKDEVARAEARDAVLRAEIRLASNAADAEAVAVSVEDLAVARERLETLQRRHRILAGALEALRKAERSTTRRAARFLEERMGRDLSRITGGRYSQVRVDEETLAISVWSAERGGWVEARSLSEGTLDQVYMAARLGLVRLVTQDKRPPLILDDPFVTFDDERAVRALRVLRELSAEHQVIYLTASSRYDAAADAVVVLPGPDRGGSSRAPEEDASRNLAGGRSEEDRLAGAPVAGTSQVAAGAGQVAAGPAAGASAAPDGGGDATAPRAAA
jgi:hypothetical protein